MGTKKWDLYAIGDAPMRWFDAWSAGNNVKAILVMPFVLVCLPWLVFWGALEEIRAMRKDSQFKNGARTAMLLALGLACWALGTATVFIMLVGGEWRGAVIAGGLFLAGGLLFFAIDIMADVAKARFGPKKEKVRVASRES